MEPGGLCKDIRDRLVIVCVVGLGSAVVNTVLACISAWARLSRVVVLFPLISVGCGVRWVRDSMSGRGHTAPMRKINAALCPW